jgi:hypothetical protein
VGVAAKTADLLNLELGKAAIRHGSWPVLLRTITTSMALAKFLAWRQCPLFA